jgi:hypothetical protein
VTIIKTIEQKFRRFLWNGSDNWLWECICAPKKVEGLGLKGIVEWNKVACLENIWNLFAEAGSVWVAWVHSSFLRGKSFWCIIASQDSTWGWRKLPKLRSLALPHVKFAIGMGLKSLYGMICDIWMAFCMKSMASEFRVIYDAGSSMEAKVDSVFVYGNWRWGLGRSEQLVAIQSNIC